MFPDLQSPFAPDNMPQAGTPQGQPGGDLADRWRQFLGDPNSRAALLSFGASLAAPQGFGSTPMGHISQALGHAGKTVTNRDAEARKDLETDSKVMAREAAANTAAQRAQIAEANSATRATQAAASMQNMQSMMALRQEQAERLRAQVRFLELQAALYPQNQEIKNQWMQARTQLLGVQAEAIPEQNAIRQQNADTQTQRANNQGRAIDNRAVLGTQKLEQGDRQLEARSEADLRKDWRADMASRRKQNTDAAVIRGPTSPILSFEEWKRQPGIVKQAPAQQPSPQQAPQRPLTQPAGGIPAAPAPNQRQVGQVYQTPRGPMRWATDGQKFGWEKL